MPHPCRPMSQRGLPSVSAKREGAEAEKSRTFQEDLLSSWREDHGRVSGRWEVVGMEAGCESWRCH